MSTPVEAGPSILCTRCGLENPTSAKFCQRCWGFLRGRTCPQCRKQATRAGARYCEYCGTDLNGAPATAAPISPEITPAIEHFAHMVEPPAPAVVPRVEPRSLTSEEETPLPAESAVWPVHVPPGPPPKPVPKPQAVMAEAEPRHVPPVSAAPPVVVPPRQAPVLEDRPAPAGPPAPEKRSPEALPSAPREQRPRRSGSPVMTGVVVVAVVVAIGGMLALRQQGAEVRNPAAVPLRKKVATSPGPASQAAAPSSPQGSPTGAPTQTAPATGTVKVTTSPAGAQVELDGTAMGVTVLTLADVKPGTHVVKISKTGFQPMSRDLQVTAGETVLLDLTLTSTPLQAAPRRRQPAAPPPPPPPPP